MNNKRGKREKSSFQLGEPSPRINKSRIRRSYESSIDNAARIAAFATCEVIDSDTDIYKRQIDFLVDDIVTFSLSARRLIADGNFLDCARNISIPTYIPHTNQLAGAFRIEGCIPLSRVLNIIIHNEMLEVIRGTRELLGILGKRIKAADDIVNFITLDHKYFRPKLLIKSDQSEVYIIEIASFIEIFLTEIMEPLVNYCAEQMIFLDEESF